MDKRVEIRGKLLLAAVVALLSACGEEQAPQVKAPPEVGVLVARGEPYASIVELPGRIEPVRVAEVRARVAGIVLERRFREGADVKAGDVLFRIDPAPFEAALAEAKGNLAKAEAALFEASSVVKRYKPLVEIAAVSQQDFDTAQAALKSAEAVRQTAAAQLKTAQLNLGYATVRAPISGRIGRALVTEGALVGQNEATPMATIQQLDPVYADFMQPAAVAVKLRAAIEEGKLTPQSANALPLSVKLDGSNKKREGKLLFSDVTVDPSTGEISLRGELPNADKLLLPGMYVRVQVSQGTEPSAIFVPQRAVLRDGDGLPQVLVVNPRNVVEARRVATGEMRGADWHITTGLKDGDRVVVGGLEAVQAGTEVKVLEGSPQRVARVLQKG